MAMTSTLNRRQVLEMIASHTVDEEEGIRLLKALCQAPPRENTKPGHPTGEKNISEHIQQELAAIASRILGVEEKELDPGGDLYESGFESVTLTKFADEISRVYDLEIMPTVFFELQPSTFSGLARYLFHTYEKYFRRYYTDKKFGGDRGQKNEFPGSLRTRGQQLPGPVCEPTAIIGMSGRFPGSPNLEIFWKHLEAGDDLISEIPRDRWDWKALFGDMSSARWGGFISDVDKFDAEFFGISPREARLMDPQQRLFLETVWETIEDAGYKASDLGGTRTGIFVGVSVTDYQEVIFSHPTEVDPHTATGLSHAVLANRVSYLLNLHGPSEPIDTACSSSLVVIKRAMESIQSGTSEMAIAGGVNVILSPKGFIAFNSAGMLAKDGRCKTFDHRADGYVRSEGVGAVFLKPLSRAEADGDHIYGIIIGASENHGGRAHSLTAPNANAQAALLIDTYENAQIDPAAVTYIETHGTGTELGDPVEINGLKKAFNQLYKRKGKPMPTKPYCGIGSVKTNIGHLEAAAGIASLIKVLLAVKHKKIPANIHFQKLNPYLELDHTPFYVVNRTGTWNSLTDDRDRPLPRRAGISSFGFGGTNAHLVVEEYCYPPSPSGPPAQETLCPQIIVLSARTRASLNACVKQMLDFLPPPTPGANLPGSSGKIRRELLNEISGILDVDEHDIELDTPLTEYGFDRVGFSQLAVQLEEKYNYKIAPGTFSGNPTIHTLVRSLGPVKTSTDAFPSSTPSLSLPGIAYTLQQGREAMDKRLAAVVSTIGELWEKLNRYHQGHTDIEHLYIGNSSTGEIPFDFSKDEKSKEEIIKEAVERSDFVKIARMFAAGVDIDWQLLYPLQHPRRVSLPTYPFEKTTHWVTVLPGQEQIAREREAVREEKDTAAVTGIPPANPGIRLIRKDMKKDDDMANQDRTKHTREKKVFLRDKSSLSNSRETSGPPQVHVESPGASPGTRHLEVSGPAPGQEPVKANDRSLITSMKEILAAVLFIDISKVNENKAFVEQGLDSILAVEFTRKLNEAFQVELTATKLYDYPTVNKLADYLSSIVVKTGEPAEPAAPSPTHGFISQFAGGKPLDLKYFQDKFYSEVPVDTHEPVISGEPPPGSAGSGIAIIGMSARFPRADHIAEYWENLANGVDAVTEVPPDRWDVNKYYHPEPDTPGKTYCKWGGFLQDIDRFDPLFFSISPAEAEMLDPQQRLFLQEAWHAIEDAGYSAESLNNVRCGIYVGVMSGNEYPSPSMFNAHSILAARLSYFLNLRGPAMAIDTACSSSLAAIHLAGKSLLEGETDMMLAGGVSLYLTEKPFIGMSRMGGIISREGKCKTFDNSADGFVPGEGVGVVVLKLLEKAIADGDHIYGVIKASGMNQDGKTNGITAPSAESQKDLELFVYKKYGINPETITYVETHGTGTKLGDPIEIEALTEAFRHYTQKKQYCPIGSVKTNLGHTSAAAGTASVIKVLLAMKHQKIPPSLHFHRENEHISFKDSPFYVNTRLTEWEKPAGFPRKAAVSSFGYSGTNVHLVIEEPPSPGTGPAAPDRPFYFIPISAGTPEGLAKKFADLLDWQNREGRGYSIGDIGYTLARGRSHFAHRAALVVKDSRQFNETLTRLVRGETPENFFVNSPGKTAPPQSVPGQAGESRAEWVHLYLSGKNPDWDTLYPGGLYKRISLPTYPFLKERYWLPDTYFARGPIHQHPATAGSGTPGEKKPLETVSPPVRPDKTFILQRLREDLGKFLQELLKVKAADIDIKANMIEYGFDSITFMEYVRRINSTYEIDFAAETFFDLETPSIQSLSQCLCDRFKDRLSQYFSSAAAEISIESGHNRQPGTGEKQGKENVKEPGRQPAAIIGIGGIMPQSDSLEVFWKHMLEGKSLFTRIPGDRWQKGDDWPGIRAGIDDKQGGFLTEPGAFDAEFFGISPEQAALMDPQQRILLEIAWKAVEDAGYKAGDLSGTKTGVFVGVSSPGYNEILKASLNKKKNRARIKNTPSMAANRISNFLNLRGPSEAIDTGGSSSLAAVNRAVEALQNGSCSMAIAGGVHLVLSPDQLYDQNSDSGSVMGTPGHSTDDAYIPGEGAGALLLKPLSQAAAENDHIYAVIKGTAENHSGGTTSGNSALTGLLIEAYKKSRVHPSGISYIETHGTAIDPNNEPSREINALTSAFTLLNNENDSFITPGKGKLRCGFGSIKGNIGNLETAAGIAGLINVLLAMKHRTLPGTIQPGNINAGKALENTPFYMVNKTIPWECLVNEKNEIIPRRAGISAFGDSGDSGTNVHIVVEEWQQHDPRETDHQEQEAQQPYLIILSAKNEERLNAYAREMVDFLENTAPCVQYPKTGEPGTDERNLRQKIGDDILRLSSGTLKTSPNGYDLASIETFVQEINKTFNLEITKELFNSQKSVGTFIKFLIKNHKDEFKNYYNSSSNPDHSTQPGTPAPNLADIAYTLQVGRQEMDERLAVAASDIRELKEKLNAYCQGKNNIENLFRGTANKNKIGAKRLMDGDEKEEFIKIFIRNRNTAKLAYCWVSGIEIDWKLLYPGKMPKRISLPTYPFARKRYWITNGSYPAEEKEKIEIKTQEVSGNGSGD
jgi:acyl transferase domain-containing protein